MLLKQVTILRIQWTLIKTVHLTSEILTVITTAFQMQSKQAQIHLFLWTPIKMAPPTLEI